MTPDHQIYDFTLTLETNEYVSAKRLSILLEGIEKVARSEDYFGSNAALAIASIDQGSIKVKLAVLSMIVPSVLAAPSFILGLQELAQDPSHEPNSFAVALADGMAHDGITAASFTRDGEVFRITREQVPALNLVKSEAFIDMEPRRTAGTAPQVSQQGPPRAEPVGEDDWTSAFEGYDDERHIHRKAESVSLKGYFTRAASDDPTQLFFQVANSSAYNRLLVGNPKQDYVKGELYEMTGTVFWDDEGGTQLKVRHFEPTDLDS